MGYTHYMYLRREGPQEQWSEAVLAVKKLLDESPVPMGNGLGEPGTSRRRPHAPYPRRSVLGLKEVSIMTTEHKTRYLLTDREYGLLELAPAMLDALRAVVTIVQAAQECIFCDSPDTEHELDCPIINACATIERIDG